MTTLGCKYSLFYASSLPLCHSGVISTMNLPLSSLEGDVVFTGAWSTFFAAAEAHASPGADLVARFAHRFAKTWAWSWASLDKKTFVTPEGVILAAKLPVYRLSHRWVKKGHRVKR